MSKIPPHLPPASCNLSNHKRWQRLKLLIFITLFSLIVGMAGASMVLGWVWPSLGGADTWIASYRRPAITKTELEERVHKEMSARIVAVYQKASSFGKINYLDDKSKLGDAIIVSSDGWIAMYYPNFNKNFEGMVALVHDNSIYDIEKVVSDKYSGMVYLKIKGEQFKAVSFGGELKKDDEIFIFQDSNWNFALVRNKIFLAENIPHLDSAPVEIYGLNNKFSTGKIAINNQGRVVGLIKKENLLLPIKNVTNILSSVLAKKPIMYPSLGLEGWSDKEKPLIIDNKVKKGFVVSSVFQKNSLFQVGDIILEINGLVVEADKLWYIINIIKKYV